MPKIDELESEAAPTLIDDAEVAQSILEMIPHIARLALRAGERDLAEDLEAAAARAEERRKQRLN